MSQKSKQGTFKKAGAAVLAAVILSGGGFVLTKNKFVDPYETVYKVADGDTFILGTQKQTVRLFGLDAPEIENCYGPESYSRLSDLLTKGKVQLKEPVVDHFSRINALVYVDGKLINEILIKEGMAVHDSKPGSAQEVFKSAHEYAKSHKLGVYSSVCTDEAPPDPDCNIKGNNDQDRHELVYLRPDCPHYSLVIIKRYEGDRWFCSEKEAINSGFKISPACQ